MINLQNSIITDLQVIKPTEKCPSGYSDYFSFIFSGSKFVKNKLKLEQDATVDLQ
jgi:hypothetical protein